mmetsp:Transcript_7043/g.8901  ORF Transcript_7043/g.8901 Transcript_7043/m.8901 type:complete len:190 (-) Transcript_7043:746-1315(-)
MPHGYLATVLLSDAEKMPENEMIHNIREWQRNDPLNESAVARLICLCFGNHLDQSTLKTLEDDSHFAQKQRMIKVLEGLIDTVEHFPSRMCPSWNEIVTAHENETKIYVTSFVAFVWSTMVSVAKLNSAADTKAILCNTTRKKLWKNRFFNVELTSEKADNLQTHAESNVATMLEHQCKLVKIMYPEKQ